MKPRPPEMSISSIAAFSATGHVHRAFGHLVAAKHGSLLVVPLPLVTGDLRQVVDGCPVPWNEVWMLIDSPVTDWRDVEDIEFAAHFPALARVVISGWSHDRLSLRVDGSDIVHRYSHRSGIKFAKV